MNNTSDLKLPDDFSLVQGGPLFQLFIRAHLATDGLGMLKRRIIFFSLITWLPLLLLSALSGQVLNSSVQIDFLHGLGVHIRFLLSLPLLLVAELVVHQRLGSVVRQFIERDIITAETRQDFEACIRSAFRLRNSIFVEIAMLIFVFVIGRMLIEQIAVENTTSWYGTATVSEMRFSLAGYWFMYVSMPIYQFMVLRWLFRIIVWARFLWQVSRLKLHLIPTHPDRAGGLGCLAESTAAFMPFLLSQGSILSVMIAQRIFYEGEKLLSFKYEVIAVVAFLVLLVLAPLCVFLPQLAKTKREGMLNYGALASRYVCEFDKKWLQGGAPEDEAFVGSGDIQSLADLNNSIEVVRTMRVLPFGKEKVLQIAVITLLPVLPLTLTMISLEDLMKRLVEILL